MALALDGSNTANNSGTSISTTLTTTNANDLIIAAISVSNSSSSVTMGGGLTWTFYNQEHEGAACSIITYYAVASSILNVQAITATIGSAQEPASMTVFGISGANTSSPFDSNASLPAFLAKSGASATTNAVTGVSTSNANDMLIQLTATSHTGGGGPWLAGTFGSNSSTLIQSGSAYVGAQYYIASTTQSNITCTSNWTVGSPDVSVVFAVQQGGGAPPNQGGILTALL